MARAGWGRGWSGKVRVECRVEWLLVRLGWRGKVRIECRVEW